MRASLFVSQTSTRYEQTLKATASYIHTKGLIVFSSLISLFVLPPRLRTWLILPEYLWVYKINMEEKHNTRTYYFICILGQWVGILPCLGIYCYLFILVKFNILFLLIAALLFVLTTFLSLCTDVFCATGRNGLVRLRFLSCFATQLKISVLFAVTWRVILALTQVYV